MIRLCFLFAFSTLLAACGGNKPPPSSGISMAPIAWTIGPIIDGRTSSIGMPQHPSQGNPGWYFDFPKSCGKQPDCSVHYVTTSAGGIKPTQSISATFTITASSDAVFNCKLIPNNPEGYSDEPSETMFILQHANDDWSTELYRYFSYGERVTLASGTFTMTVPLTPDKWISMMGKPATTAIIDTLNNLANVGLVFGGCGYAGHGVQMGQGNARFALSSFVLK